MAFSSVPLLVTSDRQDVFSMAYVRAVAGAAGYNVCLPDRDRNKTDIFVEHYTGNGFAPDCELLRIQVKCSYDEVPNADGTIHYSLDVSTYDFYREDRFPPRIIVLVLVPRPDGTPVEPWLECIGDVTILRYQAYWLCIAGANPAPAGQTTTTVYVPLSNQFDVDSLHEIMYKVATGVKRL